MNKKWEQVGVVGVDSGRLTLTDYPDHPTIQHEAVFGRLQAEGWPQAMQVMYELGHAGAGVVVSAGLGDGLYPVFVRYEDCGDWGRRIAEVKVEFLPHPVLGGSATEELLKEGEQLFLANLTIRDGEFEYLEQTFIKAQNLDEAEAKAEDYARNNFSDEDEPATPVDGGRWYEEAHGYRMIKVDSVREMESLERAIQTIGIIE